MLGNNVDTDEMPSFSECSFVEDNSGMKLYAPRKTLLFSYEPKIKVMAIGKENQLDTKSLMLLGATGAGKTCLINALVNHLMGVQFKDNYRYLLKDETGDRPKSFAESQTDFVVGYLIYVPPGSKWKHNYLIVDTPGFKDSRGEAKDNEVTQQIKTFLQDVDGVDELNLIGFVVNGTIARLQPQFSDIIETFCEIFGENAKEIIHILVSFGHMKRPPVMHVLEASCLSGYKTFIFDNCALNESNKANEEYSEEEIDVSRSFWSSTAKVYDSLLTEIANTTGVSLTMTRKVLENIQDLEVSVGSVKNSIDSYLDCRLQLKQCENDQSELATIINANKDYNGTVDVKVRDVVRGLKKASKLIKHSHNCESCYQTCRYPCDRRKHCPDFNPCDKCPCPSSSHHKSHELISHHIEKRPVVHEDKKALYEDAKAKESAILEDMTKVTQEIDDQKKSVEEQVQVLMQKFEKIRQNSLGKKSHSSLLYIQQALNDVKTERLDNESQSQMLAYVVPILDDLCEHLKTFVSSKEQ